MKRLFLSLLLLFPLRIGAQTVNIDYHKGDKNTPAEMESVGVLQGSPEKVWVMVFDLNGQSRFMPRVNAAFFITDEGVEKAESFSLHDSPNTIAREMEKYKKEPVRKQGGLWKEVGFKLIDTPFPVTNRWLTFSITNDETKSRQHIFTQCWQSEVGNIKETHGCFVVEPGENPNTTRLTFSQVLDPGGHIPEWAMKLGAGPTTRDMYKAMQKEIGEKPKLVLK